MDVTWCLVCFVAVLQGSSLDSAPLPDPLYFPQEPTKTTILCPRLNAIQDIVIIPCLRRRCRATHTRTLDPEAPPLDLLDPLITAGILDRCQSLPQ